MNEDHDAALSLAVFRIGVAVVLLGQLIAVTSDWIALYTPSGVVQSEVTDLVVAPGLPRLEYLIVAGQSLGLPPAWVVRIVVLCLGLSLYCLLVGFRTRWAASVAWLAFLTTKTTGFAATYGAHEFANIALFYCIVLPVGAALSFDARAGRTSPRHAALWRWVIRIHLMIVYLSSGVEKASGTQWRTGEAIWRALMRPEVSRSDWSWIAQWPTLLLVSSLGTVAIEVLYPFLVLWKRTRTVWLLATLSMHIGIAILLRLWTFSGLMISFNLGAFLPTWTEKSREKWLTEGSGPRPTTEGLLAKPSGLMLEDGMKPHDETHASQEAATHNVASQKPPDERPQPIILFDGTCRLCNGFVYFVISRDPKARFRFAALQSVVASRLLLGAVSTVRPQSVILLDQGRVFTESAAVIQITRRLRWPWPLVGVFSIIPRPIRDGAYAIVARNRHSWFGRSDTCMIPSPKIVERFLD